jgi:ankyrin repeat protein
MQSREMLEFGQIRREIMSKKGKTEEQIKKDWKMAQELGAALALDDLERAQAIFAKIERPVVHMTVDHRCSRPLMVAARAGSAKCVEWLLTLGNVYLDELSADDYDRDGRDALMHAAAANDDGQCVRLILDFDAKRRATQGYPARGARTLPMHARRDHDGKMALALAAARGNLGAIYALLAVGDANAQDQQGRTPLMLALREGKTEAAKALLPVSDLSVTSGEKETALMHAAAANDLAMVELLLPLSDPMALAEGGDSALLRSMKGRESPDRAKIVARLAEASDPKRRDEAGRTALAVAVRWLNDDEASVLPILAKLFGADTENHDGQTALMEAAERGSVAMVRELSRVSNHAARDMRGASALDYAEDSGQDDPADVAQAIREGYAWQERQALAATVEREPAAKFSAKNASNAGAEPKGGLRL